MEALTLGLLLLAAVLASSLIDQIIPRVSLPLIQIAIGLLIAVVAGGDVEVTLDPELFLVMFIAPLLYDEAKHADKQALWRERKPVLSLAIGLVVATTLVIGFLLNAFVPSIPLAAALRPGRGPRPHGRRGGLVALEAGGHPEASGLHVEGRAASERRLGHRVLPVRHRRRGHGLPSR